MKLGRLILLPLAALWIFAGCRKAGDAKGKTDVKIGVVISTLNNPFFVSLRNGAAEKAKELGYTLITLDSQNDPMKERANIEDLITRGVSVLLINPVDSDSVGAGIKQANRANIPVITLDRSATEGVVANHVVSDNVAGGRLAAEFLISRLAPGGAIAELEGIPGSSSARERGKGFDDAVKGKLNIVAKQSADFDRTKGLTVAENMLEANPSIQAIFAQNDEMALGAIRAVESKKRSGILVVGFDATADAIIAVAADKMAATIAQKPAVIGEQGIINAHKLLNKQAVPAETPVELELISKK